MEERDFLTYEKICFFIVGTANKSYGRACGISTTENYVELDVSSLPTDWYQLVLHYNGQILDSGSVYIQH